MTFREAILILAAWPVLLPLLDGVRAGRAGEREGEERLGVERRNKEECEQNASIHSIRG
jgi:hypothetical protein